MYRFHCTVFIFLLFFTGIVEGQRLDPADFHIHRASLNNSKIKFEQEKKGRVVFLGGSITHNPGWRDSICHYLQIKFPETEFDFINAGIPSMGSTPGAFRFERDALSNGKVDLLFEEAAVNDDTNRREPEEITRAMEGIIRHARIANPLCDVVMMHFVDPGKMSDYRNGTVPEVIRLHEQAAEHYNISTLNLAKEVTRRIDAGEFTWEDDFKNLHPSPFGQNIYYLSMKKFLEDAWSNDAHGTDFIVAKLPPALDPYNYENGVLIEPGPVRKIKGWEMVKNWVPGLESGTRANYVNVPMLVGEYPGEVIQLKFKGNAVGIAVAAGPDAGIIEYSIDKSEWQQLDMYQKWSKGLYLPWYYTLGTGLKGKRHVVQLRLTGFKNEKSKGNKCILRYFYVNEVK